jgi:hypothetical protein
LDGEETGRGGGIPRISVLVPMVVVVVEMEMVQKDVSCEVAVDLGRWSSVWEEDGRVSGRGFIGGILPKVEEAFWTRERNHKSEQRVGYNK